ncbi:ATP-binding cassette domain-containing protein [Xanthomonas oryzae pv. oryzae]|nr:ATP-binding cassette domain-containing protein [Xanthomonas oryzae pv. oryzae]
MRAPADVFRVSTSGATQRLHRPRRTAVAAHGARLPAVGAARSSDARMWEVLADVGLCSRLQRDAQGLDTPIDAQDGRLSGGESQRLLLAQVLLRRPTLAVLDEATSALDADAEHQVLSTLRARLPTTVLLVVSHRTSLAAVADRTVNLNGTPVRRMHMSSSEMATPYDVR